MLYDIRLGITYAFQSPVSAGRQLLHLMPADLSGEQRLIAGSLSFDPQPAERADRQDFFGNRVVEAAYRFEHEFIGFSVQARVERFLPPDVLDISPPLREVRSICQAVRTLGPASPLHFLGATPRVPLHDEMTAYALAATQADMSLRTAVGALGMALHRDMRFDPRATEVDTPVGEAFANRHGVCQDFSHVMIGCLRGLGIPAGYVSGFLRTRPPEGQVRLAGADAMHAWVRAWCGPQVGWVEYDPTNALWVGADHVVVARGRDYFDVAPVRGVLRTSGGQTSTQQVDVIPVE